MKLTLRWGVAAFLGSLIGGSALAQVTITGFDSDPQYALRAWNTGGYSYWTTDVKSDYYTVSGGDIRIDYISSGSAYFGGYGYELGASVDVSSYEGFRVNFEKHSTHTDAKLVFALSDSIFSGSRKFVLDISGLSVGTHSLTIARTAGQSYTDSGGTFTNPPDWSDIAFIDLWAGDVANNSTDTITTDYGITWKSLEAVPEPQTYGLICGLALMGFGLYRRCKQ